MCTLMFSMTFINGPPALCASIVLLTDVCNAAGVLAGRRARGRSARGRPGAWKSGGRHYTAGQYGYVPLGRHLVYL